MRQRQEREDGPEEAPMQCQCNGSLRDMQDAKFVKNILIADVKRFFIAVKCCTVATVSCVEEDPLCPASLTATYKCREYLHIIIQLLRTDDNNTRRGWQAEHRLRIAPPIT
ncbi:hypothetical protein J3458_005357 [Metarhizium acridum]|uniref:uncharacterized protein n=1 Tax=Metarhizium acridum TaxID=92637 RepID=UPI001C6BB340|nr:hypothetical protein J3458_005357 [Metarhizium acridum]